MPFEPKFPECSTCRHFSIRLTKKCRACDVGEFYEEDIEELDPDEDCGLIPRGSKDDDEG